MGISSHKSKGKASRPRYSTAWMGETSLDWTPCYLFTRPWEIGRWKSRHKRAGEFSAMRSFSERARASGSDWMRGQVDPPNWERRFEIPKGSWHETWLNYERDVRSKMTWIGYLKQCTNSIRFTWMGWSGRMTSFGVISFEKGMFGMMS